MNPDTTINGTGTLSGGAYGKVSVNGMGKCDGMIRAEQIQINGTFTCPGVLGAEKIGVNGSFTCEGDVNADHIKVDGRMKCSGALTAVRVDVDGMTEVRGDVYAGELDVDGSLKVSALKLEAQNIKCDGMIKVAGQISADVLDADGYISAREIVGDKITINSYSHVSAFLRALGGLAIFGDFSSKAELIEATTVRLRGVTAQSVNGQDITIGPGCIIEHLDCSGTLSLDPGSTVRTITGTHTRV